MENTLPNERTAQQTTRDILQSTTERTSPKSDRPHHQKSIHENTKELLRATAKEPPKQEEEKLPELEPPGLDFEPDRDRNNDKSSKSPSLRERVKATVERLGEKYPKTAETARLVGRFVREEGTEVAAKAAKRQAAGTVMPGWGHAAMGAYSSWDTYKDLRAFIDYAKKHPELKPSRLNKQNKPFHEVAKAERDKLATRVEDSYRLKHGKIQQNQWTGKAQYSSGINTADVGHEARRLSKPIRDTTKSFEERLSESASRVPQQMAEYRRQGEKMARQYERNNMRGKAEEKYQWLLNGAEKGLGKGYFNPESNPKGVIAYERFAREHLHVSGYSKADIDEACKAGVTCTALTAKDRELYQELGKKDAAAAEASKRIAKERLSRANNELQLQLPQKPTKDLDDVHVLNERFQKVHPAAAERKLTVEEYTAHRDNIEFSSKGQRETSPLKAALDSRDHQPAGHSRNFSMSKAHDHEIGEIDR